MDDPPLGITGQYGVLMYNKSAARGGRGEGRRGCTRVGSRTAACALEVSARVRVGIVHDLVALSGDFYFLFSKIA